MIRQNTIPQTPTLETLTNYYQPTKIAKPQKFRVYFDNVSERTPRPLEYDKISGDPINPVNMEYAKATPL